MKLFVTSALLLALSVAGVASAGSVVRNSGNAGPDLQAASGLITVDGHADRGTGFTVTHPSTGEYTIAFNRGFLGKACASMVVSGTGPTPVTAIVIPTLCQPTARFAVFLYHNGKEDKLVDSGFQFIALETPLH